MRLQTLTLKIKTKNPHINKPIWQKTKAQTQVCDFFVVVAFFPIIYFLFYFKEKDPPCSQTLERREPWACHPGHFPGSRRKEAGGREREEVPTIFIHGCIPVIS